MAISRSPQEPDITTGTFAISDQEPGNIFINRDLFSSYYLGTLLAREVRGRLGETGTRMPLTVRRRLVNLWERVAPTFGESSSYPRTREAWITPLLTSLGYKPLTEAHATDFDEETLPTGYVLYRPVAQIRGQHGSVQAALADLSDVVDTGTTSDEDNGDNDHAHTQTAVLLSLLSWGTDFDRPFQQARRRGDLPHKLMERLLAAGPAQWGLLCNGRRLRLLKRNVVAGRQHYFEVDLETLFESGSERDFDTFWTLFHARAFAPDQQGSCLLDVVDEGSRKHAEGVSSTLKESVFRAIEMLMSTLVSRAQELRSQQASSGDSAANQQHIQAEKALKNLPLLYQQSLVLLYRLLFVLYAESRTLLPADNAVYRDSYSLEPLRDEIMEPDVQYQPDSYRLWESIQALFRLIQRGCNTSQLVVPAYNGNLFSPESITLLNAIRVPDNALATVLRELSVTPPTRDRGRERIDYQDLGVEQLGAVYEGLLEFEPHIASEPMVEIKYKSGHVVIPVREQREYTVVRQFSSGQFYLGLGAGRKTSGSYYTPQPLVDFLVRRTLGPLVEGKTAEQILELKVVDPAMGSGAFLVGACLFLADAYARALQTAETSEPPRTDASSSYDLSEIIDAELSEDDTRPYRRLVAERCLYGVDLNPMAVELAKVSLWLTTLAGDKPLTFLDANLRCGNSLIGAPLRSYTLSSGRGQTIDTIHPEANKRLLKARGERTQSKKKGEENGYQLSLFEEIEIPHTLEPLVGRRQWIAETPSDTVARVHEKATLFHRQVEEDPQRRTLKMICDLWVATWFWHQPAAAMKPGDPGWVPPLDGQIYRELVLQLRGEQRQLTTLDPGPYLKELERIVADVRPFHWELEYPEIYYTSDGEIRAQAGFDAVLGNPPWDIIKPNSQEFFAAFDPGFRELERVAAEKRQQELLQNLEIRYIWETHVSTIGSQVDYIRLSDIYPYQSVEVDGNHTGGDANTYKLFLERSYRLLHPQGNCGIIVPSGLYTDLGCTGLRHLFFSRTQINDLLCFENRRSIFPIHRSFKFVLFEYSKQPARDSFPAAFMLHDMDVLSDPDKHKFFIPTSLIKRLSPNTLSLMEFRTQQDFEIITKIYYDHPLLSEKIDKSWTPIPRSEEFHMTHDRNIFSENPIGWPLYEGKMIHHYTHQLVEPRYWVDPAKGQEELARREIKRVQEVLDEALSTQSATRGGSRQARITALLGSHGRGPFTVEDVHTDAETPRLVFRDIARNTDERTMIATIVPSQVFISNTLHYQSSWNIDVHKALENLQDIKNCYKPSLSPFILTYLCGVFNSFVLDYILRFKVTTHVSIFYAYQLPVPRLTSDDPNCQAIAHRVAKLICIGSEFDDLRQDLLGSVNAHVATDPIERQQLQNEIDALVAHLYRLSEEEVRHILYAPYTFPLVDRAIKDGVMEAFANVEELLEQK